MVQIIKQMFILDRYKLKYDFIVVKFYQDDTCKTGHGNLFVCSVMALNFAMDAFSPVAFLLLNHKHWCVACSAGNVTLG